MSVKNTLLNRVLILAAVLFGLAACQTASDPAIKLTADEVRSTFVARAWTQGNGNFMFSPDGQYTYSDSSVKVFGTYQIADDGVLCAKNDAKSEAPGRETCFTFYREGDKYKYFHDRSGKYWPATLK